MFFDFISEFQGQRYLIVLRCQSLRSTLTLYYNAVFDVFCACSRDDNSVRIGWVTKSLYTNLLNWGGVDKISQLAIWSYVGSVIRLY